MPARVAGREGGMCDRASFLAAIRANPADDLPRLVFADWLDEHGKPERAELIRVECKLAEFLARPVSGCRMPMGPEEGGDYPCGMCPPCIERVNLEAAEQKLLGSLQQAIGVPYRAASEFMYTDLAVVWDRGFATRFIGPSGVWAAVAGRLLPESVGLTARLTDWPLEQIRPDPAGEPHWFIRLSADPDQVSVRCTEEEALGFTSRYLPEYATAVLSRRWPEVASWELPQPLPLTPRVL